MMDSKRKANGTVTTEPDDRSSKRRKLAVSCPSFYATNRGTFHKTLMPLELVSQLPLSRQGIFTDQHLLQEFDLSKGESRESTTAYGMSFLEQIRRTADKRYRVISPFPSLPPLTCVIL